MRVDRFKSWLTDRLRAAGHPAISAVDTYDDPVSANIVVRCVDGSEIYLQVVRTSPPAGEDFTEPEAIVEREPGSEITVQRPTSA